jgi:hypothetical protein
MSKLTWIDGQCASWEGVEMTEEACMARFGCVGLRYGKNDEVIGYDTDEDIFLVGKSEREVILNLIHIASFEDITYSYEDALAQAHNWATEHKNLRINNVKELIQEVTDFVWIKKIPKTVKVKDFQEFDEAVDDYFEQRHKNSTSPL